MPDWKTHYTNLLTALSVHALREHSEAEEKQGTTERMELIEAEWKRRGIYRAYRQGATNAATHSDNLSV